MSLFLCLTLVVSSFVFIPLNSQGTLNHAEAQIVVTDPGATAVSSKNALVNTLQAAVQDYFYIKEFSLDGIATGLAKLILKSMTQSILTWINSGFQGSPAFITDLQGFLLDRADQVAGDFIYNNPDLNFLCSPFQLDVKIALATTYQENRDGGFNSQCTLSNVTDNVEGFLNGSFNNGGWESWFEITQNPINTPTGAYLAAEGEMYARIVDEQGNQIRELGWSNGFLSFKVCSDTQVASGAQQNCTITTPGKIIEESLTVTLQSGTQALIEADEINEIIGALFAQLAKQAITGIYGILGLGGSRYTDSSFGDLGTDSYLDALGKEKTVSDGVVNPIARGVGYEERNFVLQNQITTIINNAQASLESAKDRYGSCITLSMPEQLVSLREVSIQQTLISTSTLEILYELNTNYIDSTDPQELLDIIDIYDELVANGFVVSALDIANAEFEFEFTLTPTVDDFEATIQSARRTCKAKEDDT